ncbi:MAG: HNH endonuclease [Ruminococcus sp.]|nr:HNH endonuclease [Ruminococcus sp.]
MTKTKVTVTWIKELIRNGDTSPFYNTKEWGALSERKRRLEHYECERCRVRGIYKQGRIVHHKKYLRLYPELALDINNLECLCDDCHNDEHHKQTQLNEERW